MVKKIIAGSLILFGLTAILFLATGVTKSSAQATEINTPEISMYGLALAKQAFNVGDVVSGSFTLGNSNSIDFVDVYYKVSLVGAYDKNNFPTGIYTVSDLTGPYFIAGNSQKTINFTYTLPQNVPDKNMGIQVTAITKAGKPLTWSDTKITVSGQSQVMEISSLRIKINDVFFTPESGPMVKQGEKATLVGFVTNPTKTKITVTPVIKIYDRVVTGTPLATQNGTTTTLTPNVRQPISIDLPLFNYSPKVYTGTIEFVDQKGVSVSASPIFRYIVDGDIVTIQSIEFPSIVKDQKLADVTVSFTGAPTDIHTGQTRAQGSGTLNVSVLDEKGNTIGTSVTNVSLDGSQKQILSIPLSEEATQIQVKAEIIKDGKTLATYVSGVIPHQQIPQENLISVFISIIFIFIIAIVVLYVLRILKKRLPVVVLFLPLMFLGGMLFAPNITHANWTQTHTLTTGAGVILSKSDVTVSLTGDGVVGGFTVLPGTDFQLQFNMNVAECSNSGDRFGVAVSAPILSSSAPTTDPNIGVSSYPTVSSLGGWNPVPLYYLNAAMGAERPADFGNNFYGHVNDITHSTTDTRAYTLPSNLTVTAVNGIPDANAGHTTFYTNKNLFGGNYTAPTTPGTYRIYFTVMNLWYQDPNGYGDGYANIRTVITGYQDITVVNNVSNVNSCPNPVNTTNVLQNPDFSGIDHTGLTTYGAVTTVNAPSTRINNWTVTQNSVDLTGGGVGGWLLPSGARYVIDLIGTPGPGRIYQNIPTVRGATYTLNFAFAVNPDRSAIGNATYEFTQPKILNVVFSALSSANDTTGTFIDSYTKTATADAGETLSTINWQTLSKTFTATSPWTQIAIGAADPGTSGEPANLYRGPLIGNLTLQTCTLPTTQPIMSTCSVSPSTGAIGDTFTWTASTPTGGDGSNYAYSWIFDGDLSTSVSQSVTKTYSSPGNKTGSVSITSGGDTRTFNCLADTTGNPYIIVTGGGTPGVCSATHFGCDVGTSPVSSQAGDDINGYAWTCVGPNSGGAISCSQAGNPNHGNTGDCYPTVSGTVVAQSAKTNQRVTWLPKVDGTYTWSSTSATGPFSYSGSNYPLSYPTIGPKNVWMKSSNGSIVQCTIDTTGATIIPLPVKSNPVIQPF